MKNFYVLLCAMLCLFIVVLRCQTQAELPVSIGQREYDKFGTNATGQVFMRVILLAGPAGGPLPVSRNQREYSKFTTNASGQVCVRVLLVDLTNQIALWATYPATTNVNMGGYSITNISTNSLVFEDGTILSLVGGVFQITVTNSESLGGTAAASFARRDAANRFTGGGTNDFTNTVVEVATPTADPHAATKAYADTKALSSRVINTSAPLAGGGDLTGDRTLSITNNNGDAVTLVDTNTSLTGNSDTRLPSQKAVKTYADTKAVASRNINTSAPLTGGGNLTSDRTLSLTNEHGVTMTLISTNTALADDSSAQLVTEKAIKTYADTKALIPTMTGLDTLGGNVTTGNTTRAVQPTTGLGPNMYQSSPADNDCTEYEFDLVAGTYMVFFGFQKGNNRPIVDIKIDGALVLPSVDLYAGASANSSTSGLWTNAVSGRHLLEAIVNGKHGSSSGYYAILGFWSFDPQ